MAPAMGLSLSTVGWHALAGLLVLGITFALFNFGWIGGGDAKLAAATALWLGFGELPQYGVLAALLGGALTLALLQLRRIELPERLKSATWLARLHDRQGGHSIWDCARDRSACSSTPTPLSGWQQRLFDKADGRPFVAIGQNRLTLI